MLGAVERDQQPAVQALEWRKGIGRGNALHPLDEQPVEGAGRVAVEHLADVVVARDGGRCANGASGREAHRSPKSERDLRAKVAAMPSRVWQFDRPCPSASARWCPRNDGLCMKNTENAAMSAIVYRHACPRRLSSSPVQTFLSSDSSSSSALMPL